MGSDGHNEGWLLGTIRIVGIILTIFFCLFTFTAAKAGQDRPVFVLTVSRQPPFFSPDRETGVKGRVAVILTQALAKAGYRLNVQFVPNKRAEAMVANGSADGTVTTVAIGWRANVYRFSGPVIDVETAFFTNKSYQGPHFGSFSDAARTEVVVVLGDALSEELSGRGILANTVSNLKSAVLMMKNARIQSMLAIREQAEPVFSAHWSLEKVRVDVIDRRPLFLAVRSDFPAVDDFLKKFNAALPGQQDSEDKTGPNSGVIGN